MSDLPKIIFSDKFVQSALSYYADYIGLNHLSRDEAHSLCEFISKFFGSGFSLECFFSLKQIQHFAYVFYSYLNFTDMYPEIDKMFRNYKFASYVYNEED